LLSLLLLLKFSPHNSGYIIHKPASNYKANNLYCHYYYYYYYYWIIYTFN